MVASAHCPAVGVKVYFVVPGVAVLNTGDHVPVIGVLLVELVGSTAGVVAFWQSGPTELNVGVTTGAIITGTVFDITFDGRAQDRLEVISREITSPSTGVVRVYVGPVCPVMFVPLFFHWYVGDVPPFTGVAVKVTDAPKQTGFAEAEIVTLAGRLESAFAVTAVREAETQPLFVASA